MQRLTERHIGIRTAATLAAVLSLTAAACGSGGDESSDGGSAPSSTTPDEAVVQEGPPVDGGNLTIAVGGETDGWNPATNQWAVEGNLIGSSFLEPLMVYNSEGVPVPWLAESVTRNDDASVWTITLRQGIHFHDGQEMTAEAVAESIKFQGSPSSISSVTVGKLIGEPVATGPYTIEVPLNIPWGAFPSQLTANYGYVMAPSMLAADDKGSSAPVGTGAYRFEKAEKDRYVRLAGFDDYWGGPCTAPNPTPDVVGLCEDMGVPLGQSNGPFLDSLEFRPITDALQRSQALEAGDVDMIQTFRAQDVANLRSSFQVVTDYDSEQTFVMLSTDKAPFDNIHARKAVAHATNQPALVDLFGAGEDLGMDTSPYEEDNPWGGLAPDQTGYPAFNLDQAREEIELYKQDMAAAGEQVDTLSFKITGLATTDDLALMQAVVDQWAAVGIEASVESLKQEALITKLIGGESQAILYRNYAIPDPDQNYPFWGKDFAEGPIIINFSQFWNDNTQASLDLGRRATDIEFRKTAYAELVKERNTNVIDVWLFNTPVAFIADPNVRGLNAFRNISFAGFTSKPWVAGLWVDPNA